MLHNFLWCSCKFMYIFGRYNIILYYKNVNIFLRKKNLKLNVKIFEAATIFSDIFFKYRFIFIKIYNMIARRLFYVNIRFNLIVCRR